jgi:FG-GAP-like repeat
LNNDGREDVVYPDAQNAVGFYVKLSTGDGVYGAATHYSLPAGYLGTVGIGDFNGDGKPDLAVFSTNNKMYEFLNKGNGAFQLHTSFSIGTSPVSVIVADFNHDGHMDFAFANGGTINLWFGDGSAGFTAGPSTTATTFGYLLLGDFDGDGKADIAIGDLDNYDTVQILYGDGTGHFPATSFIRRTADHSVFGAADANGDGKTDILASTFYPTHLSHISVYYGNAARTWAETKVPLSHCAGDVATAADVNGDGLNDLIVPESDCGSTPTPAHRLGVVTRKSGGGYNPDQIVYSSSSSSLLLFSVDVLRSDRNTKPDIAFSQCTSTPCSLINHYNLQFLINTTTGNFPACFAPNAFEGIHVCSPSPGSSVSSPVRFQVGAAGQTPMRKVEVWVDGKKVGEQLIGFSHYTFMNKSLAIASGSHQVTIFAAGWDNWVEKTSFSLNVN